MGALLSPMVGALALTHQLAVQVADARLGDRLAIAGWVRRDRSSAHPHDGGPDLTKAERELPRDVLADDAGIEAQECLEVGVHALERAQDRVERLVARRVDEARLAARDAEPRRRVEHLV
jgi:hypothetical protein